jgi:hypothetical protein
MYRACSTWQYEVVAHLLEHHCNGLRLGYVTGEQYASLVRDDAACTQSGRAEPRRWRVIKSHEGDRSFARALAERRALAVYAHRDVRDVVFSLMHKRGMTFEELLRQGMIHQVLANDCFWTAQPGVLIQRYDHLLADPAAGVTEIAQHLGIALEESSAARIADLYSAESNNARTEALRRKLQQAGVDLESAANAQICDPTTLLHWNHMRQGKAGSWRTSATARQLGIMDRMCGRWLEAHGYSMGMSSTHSSPSPPRGEGGRRPGEGAARSARVSGIGQWRWPTGLAESISLKAFGELVRDQANMLAGLRTYLVRSTSQRFPGTARVFKRLLGLPAESNAGATTWADATPTGQAESQSDALDGVVASG